MLLAHVQPKIQRTYDFYEFVTEKRAALEAWQAALEDIVEGRSTTNVVSLT